MFAIWYLSTISPGVISPPFNNLDVNSLLEFLIPVWYLAILKLIDFSGSTGVTLKPASPANSSPSSKLLPYSSVSPLIVKPILLNAAAEPGVCDSTKCFIIVEAFSPKGVWSV